MPVWIPLLKASLPFVTQIVTSAIPAFTAKPAAAVKTDDLTAQQITELQTAVTHNAESIKVLAEKLQLTIQGIDQAAVSLQKEIVYFKRLAFGSICVAGFSLVLAVLALLQ